MSLSINPTEATLGAVVTGIALAELDDAGFAEIEAAWHQHAVLIFPEQHLSESQHLAFTPCCECPSPIRQTNG